MQERLTREFTSLQMPGFLFTAIENFQTGIGFRYLFRRECMRIPTYLLRAA